MANTIVKSGNVIQITGLDADWLWSSLDVHFHHLGVISIQFNPSAANDIMLVQDVSITGPAIFKVKCSGDTDQRIKYFYGSHIKPVIDISSCTLGTAANAMVLIHFGNYHN